MKTYAIDFETYFDDECSVKPLGAEGYARHHKFHAYIVSIYGEDLQWVGDPLQAPWEKINGHIWLSHNAGFEFACLKWCQRQGCEIYFHELIDTTGLAVYLGSGRSLVAATKAFLPQEANADKAIRDNMKGKTFKDLTPESQKAMLEYALHDSELCYKLWKAKGHLWPKEEQKLAALAWQQGAKGLPIDIEGLKQAIATLTTKRQEIEAGLPWIKEGFKPSSTKAIYDASIKAGIPPPKSTNEDDPRCQAWEKEYGQTYSWVKDVRRWRKTNKMLATLDTILKRYDPTTGRMPYSLKYYGGHTGRWSGDAGLNVQAFQRNSVEGISVRRLIKTKAPKKLIVADLAQIEPRCLAWLCGDENFLAKLRQGHGLYQAHAEETMGWTGGKLKTENPKLYRLAKARVLGLGYGCGAERFVEAAKNLADYDISLKDAKTQVDDFRLKNPRITMLWNSLERHFKAAAKAKSPVFEVELPSGRKLRYFNPRIKGGQCVASVEQHGMEKFFWGGKLCLSGRTQVKTKRGWKKITDVLLTDKVWDGRRWVSHDGVVYNGVKATVPCHGVDMTADHLVLTSEGWCPADEARHLNLKALTDYAHTISRLDRQNVRKLNRIDLSRVDRKCAVGACPQKSRRSEPVYDVQNAGKRHRFLVRGSEGAPEFLVHNCENLTQATARDVLAHILLTLQKHGHDVLFHVHDDFTIETDTATLEQIHALVTVPPPFMPDLPLEVEIHEGLAYEN